MGSGFDKVKPEQDAHCFPWNRHGAGQCSPDEVPMPARDRHRGFGAHSVGCGDPALDAGEPRVNREMSRAIPRTVAHSILQESSRAESPCEAGWNPALNTGLPHKDLHIRQRSIFPAAAPSPLCRWSCRRYPDRTSARSSTRASRSHPQPRREPDICT